MALDGFVISNIVYELNQTILNAKISKIAQPENDELLFTCKGSNGQFRLAMSASASLPFLYLTGQNKPSPMTAPNFCMVLRKHIANGRIVKIYQPHMERIIHFDIEHLDEMGDLCQKTLIVELIGVLAYRFMYEKSRFLSPFEGGVCCQGNVGQIAYAAGVDNCVGRRQFGQLTA